MIVIYDVETDVSGRTNIYVNNSLSWLSIGMSGGWRVLTIKREVEAKVLVSS